MNAMTGQACIDYWLDACQRAVLTLDVLRQRGDNFMAYREGRLPRILSFDSEMVMDGRQLRRPVNYRLNRILPGDGPPTNLARAPFVVVDPRAGHGPGIGGMKQQSEIGMALAAGHPCYFIDFLAEPVPGQTIEDVWEAEARFIAEVASRHPEAESKPVVVANCQAGWQIMMMAATHPGETGPLLLAGAPLSYWAGVRGRNPMRYSGGLTGGTWVTALSGDLGNGIFDGAHLVANFEGMNPANTLWQKPYNVYANVDSEAARFLEFESWWGHPVLLNAGEMQWIADNLFVGNRLATGEIRTSTGLRIDLRNVRAPIVVFASWGDNITPPQQALGWITDLYEHEDEIVGNGQTIVYTLHPSIGHLGIFVSGKVASREHEQFVAAMDMINIMPPGLYEAVITELSDDTARRELVRGGHLFQLEPRTIADIRAIGGNSAEDDRRFATMARLSETNLGLYHAFAAPWVRMAVTEQGAEAMRALHPNRLRFAAFSSRNPAMAAVPGLAAAARANRRPVAADNPFLAVEKAVSTGIAAWLGAIGELRDAWVEAMFHTTYGAPLTQALAGMEAASAPTARRIERDLVREAAESHALAAIDGRFEEGGLPEAMVRGLIYVLTAVGFDEREFAIVQAVRQAQPAEDRLSLERLKEEVRTQYLLIRRDGERAVATLPTLIAGCPPDLRRTAFETLREAAEARGTMSPLQRQRLARIRAAFLGEERAAAPALEAAHG